MCSSGICICFLYYGVLQERLFTGENRLGPTFALVTACITNVAVAVIWQQVEGQIKPLPESKVSDMAPLYHALLLATSACYILAMTCSNEAIPFVSYPVAVLAKSCKLIPTMIVGQAVEGRLYSTEEWAAALLISCGIVLFHFSRLKKVNLSQEDQTAYGMALLMISLIMDGLLSSCQNMLKRPRKQYRPPNAVETMLFVNLYALIYLIPLVLWSNQLSQGLILLSNPGVAYSVLILNLTVAIGQIFIFLTITWYSPVVTTTITTTRKFFTILLSVWTFGHAFSVVQWTAVGLVFCGLFVAIRVQQRSSSSGRSRSLKAD